MPAADIDTCETQEEAANAALAAAVAASQEVSDTKEAFLDALGSSESAALNVWLACGLGIPAGGLSGPAGGIAGLAACGVTMESWEKSLDKLSRSIVDWKQAEKDYAAALEAANAAADDFKHCLQKGWEALEETEIEIFDEDEPDEGEDEPIIFDEDEADEDEPIIFDEDEPDEDEPIIIDEDEPDDDEPIILDDDEQ